MTKYGKIVCGALQVPQNYPCSIEFEGKIIHNPNETQLLAAGYLPIEETEAEVRDGKVAVVHYGVTEGKILQTWTYEDEPDERGRVTR